jgi:phospholipid/cholesterol/gamma-HCH transport system permease protein
MGKGLEFGADIRVDGGAVRCLGAWTIRELERAERLLPALPWPGTVEVVIDGSGISAMDLAGAWMLRGAVRALEHEGRQVDLRLRPEHAALLRMVNAPELSSVRLATAARPGLVVRFGAWALAIGRESLGVLAFLGESARVAARGITRPALVRWRPVFHNVQVAGLRAIPIVGMLSLLMGIVIAYQGASQLQRYGANVFVADLVGFAMLRELSPLLTAIIVAGRSGSAFAAQIGTMKVTEEIDALRTVGISPTELLVLPKILALVIALPLLTVYADAMGVLGGMIMARSELAVGWSDFLDRLVKAIAPSDYLVGIGKAPVFACIVAVIGCYQGFQVSGDAESVGRRTTVSVVQSVFLVIVVDALFSVAFSVLGI